MNRLLFVYGTLKRGTDGRLSQPLAGRADFISRAGIYGTLYLVSWYPGLIPAGGERVEGELYRMHDPEVLLNELDDYEGGEFRRCETEVLLAGGGRERAWVYFYQGSTADLEKISGGIFVAQEIR